MVMVAGYCSVKPDMIALPRFLAGYVAAASWKALKRGNILFHTFISDFTFFN